MRRIALGLLSVAAAVTALVATAAPAGAHASFVDVDEVPAGTEQALVMRVPDERDEAGVATVEVVVAMPDGWEALGCEPKPDWTCTLGTQSGRQTVQFSRAAGAGADEDDDDQFRFRVRSAPTEGTFAFPTVQSYSSGEVVRWISEEGTDTPAPRLTTTPGPPTTAAPTTTAPTTTASAPTTGPGTSTVSSPSGPTSTEPATTTAAPATTGPGEATTTVADEDDDGGSGSDWLWAVLIVIGVAAVVAGVVAQVRARQRRSQPDAPTDTTDTTA